MLMIYELPVYTPTCIYYDSNTTEEPVYIVIFNVDRFHLDSARIAHPLPSMNQVKLSIAIHCCIVVVRPLEFEGRCVRDVTL